MMEYFGWGILAVDVGESEAKKTSFSHLSVCPRDAMDEIYWLSELDRMKTRPVLPG
jgi:hypothetical protein